MKQEIRNKSVKERFYKFMEDLTPPGIDVGKELRAFFGGLASAWILSLRFFQIASCTGTDVMDGSCDVTLAVYDANGKLYEGHYSNSLLTGQEREHPYPINTACGPWEENAITVRWPE